MNQVTCSPDVLSEYNSTLVRMIQYQLESVLYERKFRAKKKWLEIIEVGGTRYGVTCHKVGDDVEVTEIRQLAKKKYTQSRKKDIRLKKY